MKRLTKEEFITKAKSIHGDKYVYDMVNYLGNRLNVKIVCKEHGIFKQTPKNHLYNKEGCPLCYKKRRMTS